MNKRLFSILSLITNALILIFTLFSVVMFFVSENTSNMRVIGFTCFRYFTIDSNVLVAICSAIMIYFNIKNIKNNGGTIPTWALMCKFIGTVAVSVTLFTVIIFLGPTQGYAIMFSGTSLFLHLINPLLALISFLVFERKLNVKTRFVLLTILPTVAYGIIYMIMVVLVGENNGGWLDFYGFNMGGKWYISAPIMFVVTYILGFVLFFLKKIFDKNISETNDKTVNKTNN